MVQWILRVFGFTSILWLGFLAVSYPAASEEKKAEQGSEFGQGIIWFPKITFPKSESNSAELWDREIVLQHLNYNIHLSKNRALEVTIDDTDFYLRVGGRIFLDYTKYFQDRNDLGSDGVGLRTFMIEADGRFNKKWLYRLSMGGMTSGGRFNGKGAFLDDAYVTYVGEKSAWQLGQHREPFGLEETTSGLSTTFMERALPSALVPAKNVGASYHTFTERFSLSAGLYGETLQSKKDVAKQGLGLTGRFVFRPQRSNGKFYHLGGSFSFRLLRGDDTIFFRSRPEAAQTSVRYINTGDIYEVNTITRFGLEGGVGKGPLSLQAEYITSLVDRESGFDDLVFKGWYAYASWFITGETRKYLPQEGIPAYPEIKSKWGAVEIAARYSETDLSDAPVLGGRERNLTFGINWYVFPKMRIMGNYIFVFCDDNADDNGTVLGNDKPEIFQVRFQWRF